MPAPISSQNTIGVASAPMMRLRWRRKRTSSRRARETAGRRSGRDGDCWIELMNWRNCRNYRAVPRPIGLWQIASGGGRLEARILPWPTIVSREHRPCLGVVLDRLFFPVPFDAPPQFHREHSQQGAGGRAVADLDVADRAAMGPDRIHEVGPEFLDVLLVGFVEL